MYKSIFKRLIDFVASATLFILLSPIFMFLFIFLTLYYRGSPFFFQKRPGYRAEIFTIIKFKSMINASDSNGNPLPDSARLTKIGKLLRKTSLDELPQLINVIRGDMSFIGPRPLLSRYLPYYNEEEQLRHTVKPGITGLAQVSGRNFLEWDARLQLDVFYVQNISAKLDFQIFIKTILKVAKNEDIAITPQLEFLDVLRKKNESPKV